MRIYPSTTARLSRIVDRARILAGQLEDLDDHPEQPFAEEKRRELEVQLAIRARRSHLVQRAATSLYVAVGLFVATTLASGVAALIPGIGWLPGELGIGGAVVLFGGCLQLIRETPLALAAVDQEMKFALRLGELRRGATGKS